MALQKETAVPLSERKLLTGDRLTRLRTAIRSAIKFRKAQSNSLSTQILNLQKDILNSPRHIFEDHTSCDSYYCTDERKKEKNVVPLIATLMLKLQKNASQLAFHSRSLMFCYTNNRAEQFNSVVAKVVGGKRINFSLKDSYAARCYAAVVIFNTGRPQYNLYKSILKKSPGHSLKALELKRHLANCKRTETGSKRCRRQLQFGSADGQYGSQCQRPDMTCDDYENAKKLFLSNLHQQTLNRQEIERNTILQAESALWLELRRCLLTASMFSKICKRRPNTDSAPLVKTLLYSYNNGRR